MLKRKLIKIYNVEEDKIEFVEKYEIKKECYSKIDLMKYLVAEYRKGSEAGGR